MTRTPTPIERARERVVRAAEALLRKLCAGCEARYCERDRSDSFCDVQAAAVPNVTDLTPLRRAVLAARAKRRTK